MRKIRGDRIAMVFQEPMTSLNPLHTIERQVNETLMLHKRLIGRRRGSGRSSCCNWSVWPTRQERLPPIRTSCRADSVSA